jgi:hypothetical protein
MPKADAASNTSLPKLDLNIPCQKITYCGGKGYTSPSPTGASILREAITAAPQGRWTIEPSSISEGECEALDGGLTTWLSEDEAQKFAEHHAVAWATAGGINWVTRGCKYGDSRSSVVGVWLTWIQ